MSLHVAVDGRPVPQGSKVPMLVRTRDGRSYATMRDQSSAALTAWRTRLAWAARAHRSGIELGPVEVTILFRMGRPAARPPRHHGWHVVRPDKDKLLRAVFDALTDGGVWKDDSQACVIHVEAKEVEPPGVDIHVVPCRADAAGNATLDGVLQ